ncbi:DUF4349 domain-containing protein [Leucobacter allii]|uniref:DUF4349 domain-containing protein n=1 Tax=Leucobacter allii TaxID=2932247 RepID=UPI001FD006C0|nr:DUF4349 domain-containing protein [Leucobacter allii]UOR00450.1 DUF4349 domain-containing protein [Leucobacter allii]
MTRRTTRSALLPLLLAAGLLLAPLTGCAPGGLRGVPDLPATDSASEAPAAPEAAGGPGDASALDDAAAGSTDGRSVVRTAELSLEVADPDGAATEAGRIAEEAEGFVEAVTVSRAEGVRPASAQLTLRVPADRLDDVLAELSGLGEPISEQRGASDVTAEHVDLEARVAALEASVRRLTELMAGAASTSELLEAEAALAQRQQELDGLQAQLDALEGQIDEATVWVSLDSPQALPGGGPANFWEGLLAGLGSLGAAGAGALVVLGILLPWLAIAGIVAIAVVALVRAARRRRARRTTPAAGPGDPRTASRPQDAERSQYAERSPDAERSQDAERSPDASQLRGAGEPETRPEA